MHKKSKSKNKSKAFSLYNVSCKSGCNTRYISFDTDFLYTIFLNFKFVGFSIMLG